MTSSPFKLVAAVAAAIGLAASANVASATSVTTDPVGFITVSAKAGSVATPVTTFIGLGMARPVAYQAVVPSASGQGATTVANVTKITFPTGAFLTDGLFGPGAGSVPNHYLEILSGTSTGVLSEITASTTNSITLADNVTLAITNGVTTFRIRPHWTFGTAFGTANQAGLLGASASASADIINVIDPITSAATGYFYNTAAVPSARWEKTDNTDATNVPISPEAGLQLARKGATDLAFKLAGAIKTGPTALYVEGAATDTFNMLVNPYPVDSVMLKDSGLVVLTNNVVDATKGLVDGTAATADLVRIFDSTHSQYNDYFYETSTGKWKTGQTDASLTVIPAGASLAIIRKAGRSPFYWYEPQPSMVLGDTPLPLSLASAVSRLTHSGSFGVADVNLPFTGAIGVEPRNSTVSGAYSIILTYSGASASNPISLPSGISLSATVAGNAVTIPFSSSVVGGNTIVISLTSVPNTATVVFTIPQVTAQNNQIAASAFVSAGFLSGDISGNRVVTGNDVTLNKGQVGFLLNLGNFKDDISGNSLLTGTDVSLTKGKVGTGL